MQEPASNLPSPAQGLRSHSKGVHAVLDIQKWDADKKADLDMLCTRQGHKWCQDSDNNVFEDNDPETMLFDYLFEPDLAHTIQDNLLWDQINSNIPCSVFDQVL